MPIGLGAQLMYGSGSIVANLAYETISIGGFRSQNQVWFKK
jgi:hypothetical protein